MTGALVVLAIGLIVACLGAAFAGASLLGAPLTTGGSATVMGLGIVVMLVGGLLYFLAGGTWEGLGDLYLQVGRAIDEWIRQLGKFWLTD